jgi:hypothetical protein
LLFLPRELSASGLSLSAEILGRRRFGNGKEQPAIPLFFVVSAVPAQITWPGALRLSGLT